MIGPASRQPIQLFGLSKNLDRGSFGSVLIDLHRSALICGLGREQNVLGEEGTRGLLTSSRALKPDRDSATNRPSGISDEGQDLAVLAARLCV